MVDRGAWWAVWLLVWGVLGAPMQAWAGPPGVITQKSQTAHYILVLQIGPEEKMYSKAEAAKLHPASGEVMVGGAMAAMPMAGMSMDTRHLELHVLSRATGRVVTDARCSITVTGHATAVSAGKTSAVPVGTMYGAAAGPADWHYGSNVQMPAGSYTVAAVVNGERATFHVTVQ
ncbi:MAG TPA: hypothetical protein VJT32_10755 [bacterium]|nr:hypothetical protein [bacterium]